MKCCNCGKRCTQDYFIVDVCRIKKSGLTIPPTTSKFVFCKKCYEDNFTVAAIRNRTKNSFYNEGGTGV